MGEASKQIDIERSGTTTAHQSQPVATTPVWKLSPTHNGSTLYDSFELRAVIQQLNRAIQGSKSSSSPPYMYCINSPLYREGLNQMHKASDKPPRRILCSTVSTTCDRKLSAEPKKGFASRAWNIVKRGLVRNKQRNIRAVS